jgi:HAD superfamily hydrolase (TIGR01509 family)
MITHLIFDLDGTLILSEDAKIQSKIDAVSHFGGKVTRADVEKLVGQSEVQVANTLIALSKITAEVPDFIAQAEAAYIALVKAGIPFVTGAKDFLNQAKNSGQVLALVTSSTRPMIQANPELQSVLPWFTVVISTEDVTHTKPNPEPYLLALEKLNIPSERALVFEDSAPGLQSAAAANIRTIFLRHNLNAKVDAQSAIIEVQSFDAELAKNIENLS